MKLKSIILVLALFSLLGFVANILITTGFFRSIENQFDGSILKSIDLTGAEDIMVSFSDSFAIISSTDRGAFPAKTVESGGLYFMDLKDPNFEITPLTTSFQKDFAPHGISMIKLDSTYKVMAINHVGDKDYIEEFLLNGKTLIHIKTIEDPLFISPNDLVIIDEEKYYVTNDHGYVKGMGKFFEEYLGLAVSNVIYYDGKEHSIVAKNIAYANGVNYDADRNLLFVASARGFHIQVFERAGDGTLSLVEKIKCGTGVDNLEFDEEGHIWTGAHPNLLRFSAYSKGQKETSPSEIIEIDYQGKADYTVNQVYVSNGQDMSASSVAAPFGDVILFGNVMDDNFLILNKPK